MSVRIVNSERLSAYAEIEPWKVEHDNVMLCYNLEKGMTEGCGILLEAIHDEVEAQTHLLEGKTDITVDDLDEFPIYYKSWLKTSEIFLKFAKRLTKDGYEVNGVARFLDAIDEARGLLAGHDIGKMMPSLDAMEAKAQPTNPNPCRYGD